MRLILVTPARNEAHFIEGLISCVSVQARRPIRWIIVDNGSNDGTAEKVRQAQGSHPWIELLSQPALEAPNMAGKAAAFNAALAVCPPESYDLIGNIDADVSIPPRYLGFLTDQFLLDPTLGVAGTAYIDEHGAIAASAVKRSNFYVTGGVQIFRGACIREIGGYVPFRHGGIDSIATVSARMGGWSTRSFIEYTYTHRRNRWSAASFSTVLRTLYRSGLKAYFIGGHPLWEVGRAFYYIPLRPCLVGSVFFVAGFLGATVTMRKRPVSRQFVAFYRGEQLERISSRLRAFQTVLAPRRLLRSLSFYK